MKKFIVIMIVIFIIGIAPGLKADDVKILSKDQLGNYLKAQEALAADNYLLAQKAFIKLAKVSKGDFRTLVKKVTLAKDIKILRKGFNEISNKVIKTKTPKECKLAYCSMAFNNKGAFWIQTGDKIMNPYFGSTMLHCGSFKDK